MDSMAKRSASAELAVVATITSAMVAAPAAVDSASARARVASSSGGTPRRRVSRPTVEMTDPPGPPGPSAAIPSRVRDVPLDTSNQAGPPMLPASARMVAMTTVSAAQRAPMRGASRSNTGCSAKASSVPSRMPTPTGVTIHTMTTTAAMAAHPSARRSPRAASTTVSMVPWSRSALSPGDSLTAGIPGGAGPSVDMVRIVADFDGRGPLEGRRGGVDHAPLLPRGRQRRTGLLGGREDIDPGAALRQV